jgi:4-amino-4-deoxy-L-arabinose transferase-like glycosyltransferase
VPLAEVRGRVGVRWDLSDPEFWTRHFRLLAAIVLALAAFNLIFRLNDDAITEWDESLYGLSAAEMLESGDWVRTRLGGQVDYTAITKPPLIVWLTALSFKTLGISPVSLRLVSAISAWLTVLVLMLWARRIAGALTTITAGVVLATSFGFMYVHSGRTGNTDALFTLLTTLTAVVLYASFAQPWARVVLGLLFAGFFLLRGPGMLMPLAIVILVEIWHRRAPHRWPALACAAVVFAIPVASWAYARWRVDQWQFLSQVWKIDLVTRTLTPFEGHTGTPLYYFDMLQRYHYDWLIAAIVALCLFAPPKSQWRAWLRLRFDDRPAKIVIAFWAVVTFAVPTLMQTKLSWYLNPFYPVFALLIGGILSYALASAKTPRNSSRATSRGRTIMLVAIIVIAFGTAEGKMLYQAYRRDKTHFLQGLLERERATVGGRTIYRAQWNGAEQFVATRMVGARIAYVESVDRFVEVAGMGDLLVGAPNLVDARLEKVREMAGEALYRKAH